jgi:hypothetical protein
MGRYFRVTRSGEVQCVPIVLRDRQKRNRLRPRQKESCVLFLSYLKVTVINFRILNLSLGKK